VVLCLVHRRYEVQHAIGASDQMAVTPFREHSFPAAEITEGHSSELETALNWQHVHSCVLCILSPRLRVVVIAIQRET
jgi:hypothetical protein